LLTDFWVAFGHRLSFAEKVSLFYQVAPMLDEFLGKIFVARVPQQDDYLHLMIRKPL
jgi:hypothetical protein